MNETFEMTEDKLQPYFLSDYLINSCIILGQLAELIVCSDIGVDFF